MTALDQAFIKAYQQQDVIPLSPVGESSRAVPLSDALAATQRESAAKAVPAAAVLEAIQRRASPAQKSAPAQTLTSEPALRSGSPRPAVSRPDARRGAAAGPSVAPPHFAIRGIEQTPSRLNDWEISEKADRLLRGDRPAVVSRPADLESRSQNPSGAANPLVAQAGGVGSGPGSKQELPEPACEPVANEASVSPAACQPATDRPPAESVAVAPELRPVESAVSEPVNRESFQSESFTPQLQVDRFRWPKVCSRLNSVAGTSLDDLASELAAMIGRQGRVVAIAAGRRGEGATTLLLCVGRRLADAGHRVILVDADAGQADLARRLGLLPECGWEDVLCGRLPIDEVAVQSLDDRLTVLPLKGAGAWDEGSTARIAESLETLRAHYDAVLVNLAPVNESQPAGELPAAGLARHLDAAVVVQDVRPGRQRDAMEACRRLEAQGVDKVALVENFG